MPEVFRDESLVPMTYYHIDRDVENEEYHLKQASQAL